MNAHAFSTLMNSAHWISGGRAMLEFAVAGSIIWIVAAVVRLAIQRFHSGWRYAMAGITLLALVTAAGVSLTRHWPNLQLATPSIVATTHQESSGPVVSPTSTSVPLASHSPEIESVVTTPIISSASLVDRTVRWLPWVWCFGVPFVAMFVACGWVGAARLRGDSTLLPDGELREVFQLCKYRLNVVNAGIAICERLAAPIVVGILKPVILIPPGLLTSLSFDQWEMILLHELAHIRRRDNLFNLLQRVTETLLFFHPAVWWASRWMRLEREHCCDDVVLSRGATAQSYAETLAVLALPGLSPQLATAAMANHQLLARMRHILGSEDLHMAVTRKRLATGIVVLGCVAGLMSAGIQSFGNEAATEKEKPKDETESSQVELSFVDETNSDTAITAAIDFLKANNEDEGQNDADLLFRVKMLKSLLGDADSTELSEVKSVIEKTLDRLNERKATPSSRAEHLRRFAESAKKGRAAKSYEIISGDSPHTRESVVRRRLQELKLYGASQVTGPPNVEVHGDNGRAWAAKHLDRGEEWIAVGFDEPRAAVAVVICESFNPGAIAGVDVGIAGDQRGESEIRPVWTSSGVKSTESPGEKKVTVIPLSTSKDKIQGVTVHIDERRVSGWNEIDAIGLIDADSGAIHWATEAVASSSYGDTPTVTTIGKHWNSRPVRAGWGADQATGAPNVAEAGDNRNAWASATKDNQPEWLELTYDPPVQAAAVMIYESYNPGALSRVTVQEAEGAASHLQVSDVLIKEMIATNLQGESEPTYWPARLQLITGASEKSIWEGTDPVQSGAGKGVAIISVPAGVKAIRRVKLYLDSPRVQGWNEIDAVGLVNVQNGEVQWASSAAASSNYGESAQEVFGNPKSSAVPIAVSSDTGLPYTASGADQKSAGSKNHDQLMRDYNALVDQLTRNQCSKCHQTPYGWLRDSADSKESKETAHEHFLNSLQRVIRSEAGVTGSADVPGVTKEAEQKTAEPSSAGTTTPE